MKHLNFSKLFLIVSLFSLFISCKKEEEEIKQTQTPPKTELIVTTNSNLHAPQGGGGPNPASGTFVKFSFATNTTVTGDNWDLAFRGTTILVNGGSAVGITPATDEPARTGMGGVSIQTALFSEVKTAESLTFRQDGALGDLYAIKTGSGNGWYNYDGATNIISPLPGKVFVIKTHDGKYVKMEIISYYKDAPATPDATSLSRYYTFRFVYQPSGTAF